MYTVKTFNSLALICPARVVQVQLYCPSCEGERDLSNQTRISTIQSRRPEKKAKSHVMLTLKIFHENLNVSPPINLFLSFNPKMLEKLSQKLFPAIKEARKGKEEERRDGKKSKSKSRLLCHFKTQKLSRNLPEPPQLIFCMWNRRLLSA